MDMLADGCAGCHILMLLLIGVVGVTCCGK